MEEIWKDIEQYKGLYQISNLGRVKSLYGWNGHNHIKRVKILKPSIERYKNYCRCKVKLCGKDIKVHRLVAEAFIPKINGKNCVNHKDFNPLNNCVDNLEWCTQKENIEWSYLHKRYSQVDKGKIIELYKKGITAQEIAKKFNVKKNVVYYIAYTNNIKRSDFKRKSKYISIEELKKMFNKGMSNKEISELCNIPNNYIARRRYQIKKGEI